MSGHRLTGAQRRILTLLEGGWEIDIAGAGYLLERYDDDGEIEVRPVSTWTVQSLIRRQRVVFVEGRWIAPGQEPLP